MILISNNDWCQFITSEKNQLLMIAQLPVPGDSNPIKSNSYHIKLAPMINKTKYYIRIDSLILHYRIYLHGVDPTIVPSAATQQPENLYPYSFRLFTFPTRVSVQIFQGYKLHEYLIITSVGKLLFSDTQCKPRLISNGG